MPEQNKSPVALKLASIMHGYVGKTGGLISALRQVQAQIGFLPEEAVSIGADEFNLSRAEVKGVISFYSDFHSTPKGRTVIRLCAAEACQAVGGRELQAGVEKKYALKMGNTSASKDLSLEPVYCLGLCSCAPAAIVGGKLVGHANLERIMTAVENDLAEQE